MPANKPFPIPIRFTFHGMDMITFVAHLTGISRLHKQNLDTMLYSFVDKELPQLEERPTITKSAFFVASRLLICALPNPSQIF